MIGVCLVMFGQKANAVTITVDPFDVRFSDAFPQAGCTYTIQWRLVISDGSYASLWISGGTVSSTGSYTMSAPPFTGVPIAIPPEYYIIQVKVTKNCTGEVRYGYSNPLDLDDQYHLSPNGITVKPSF